MFVKTLRAILLSTSFIFVGAAHAADDPTIHQIYAAAEAGRFADAQRMMDKVLHDHPNSAKAHFVEAELFAKQGRTANAAEELNKAEALEPGLPFAKPQSVQQLQRIIAGAGHQNNAGYIAPSVAPSNGIGMSTWLVIGGAIIALIFGLRALFSRRATTYASVGNTGYGGYGASPSGQMPPAGGSGIGSSIVGGLATGAAVGAGMVAGEALAHHFLDGDDPRRNNNSLQPPVTDNYPADNDLGGNDFGIADNSSWDDSSSFNDDSGGNDW